MVLIWDHLTSVPPSSSSNSIVTWPWRVNTLIAFKSSNRVDCSLPVWRDRVTIFGQSKCSTYHTTNEVSSGIWGRTSCERRCSIRNIVDSEVKPTQDLRAKAYFWRYPQGFGTAWATFGLPFQFSKPINLYFHGPVISQRNSNWSRSKSNCTDGSKSLCWDTTGLEKQHSIPAGQLLVSTPLPHNRSKGMLGDRCPRRWGKKLRFKHRLNRLEWPILIDEIWMTMENKSLGMSVSGCLRLTEVGRTKVGIIPWTGFLDWIKQ